MGERDELIELGQSLIRRRQAADEGVVDRRGAVAALVDAGWRPPAPAAEHPVALVAQAIRGQLDAEDAVVHEAYCEQPLNDEQFTDLLTRVAEAAVRAMPRPEHAAALFEGTVTSAGSSPVKVMVHWRPDVVNVPDAGTEVAVYRKGEGPARWPTHDPRCQDEVDHDGDCTWPVEPDSGDPGSAARPVDPPADLKAAVARALAKLDRGGDPFHYVVDIAAEGAIVAALAAQGVTVRPRPPSDAERLSKAFESAIGSPLSDGDLRALLDAGVRPPALPSEADLLTEALVRHGVEQPLAGMVGEFLFQDGWGRVDG